MVKSDRKASLVFTVKSLLERTPQVLTNVQISRRKVPANRLVRPDDRILIGSVHLTLTQLPIESSMRQR